MYVKWSYTTLVKTHSFDYFLNKIPEVYSIILISLVILTALLFLSSIILYLIRKKSNIKTLTAITILFIFLDLFLLNSFTLNPSIIMKSEFNASTISEMYQKTPEIEFLQQDKTFYRIYERSGILPQHLSTKYGIQSAGGYSSVTIKYYDELIKNAINLSSDNENISKILGLANVKYILSNKELTNPRFEKIYSNSTFIYLNKDFLPRAYVQENLKEANITYYSPNRINLEINMDKPGTLILSEVYYPGWKAYDNSKETEIYKANYAFRSIYLEKGEHKIEFIYKPKPLLIGIYITLFTFLILIILIAYLIHKPFKTTIN